MEEISRDYDHIRRRIDDAVNGGTKGLGHVGLSLIDAARCLPMVLTDAEVRIRNVCEFHGWRMNTARGKGKKSGASHTARRHASERESPAGALLLPR